MNSNNMRKSEKMETAFVEVWNGQVETYPEMKEDAILVVDYVKKYFKEKVLAKKIADIQMPVSDFWRKFVPQVKTSLPKTDIVIGKYKFSMKYRKEHLLFSGGQGETLGAFYAALEDNNEKFRNYVMNVVESQAAVLKNVRADDKFNIDLITGKHGKVRDEIQKFFDSNKDFQTSLLIEVLSGQKKFEGNNIAIANAMLLYGRDSSTLFTLTKDNVNKHIPDVKVNISWRKMRAGNLMRSLLTLSPGKRKIEEGIVDSIKSIILQGWDKILKLFGLEPEIDIEIKW